ncbi:MAG: hypothetical protein NTW30_05650 [Candidatus Aenigmarchaeota archaeon]|nr:hypothetical protein [Candidatus Aenigmarchaeota archaeon]
MAKKKAVEVLEEVAFEQKEVEVLVESLEEKRLREEKILIANRNPRA